MAVFEFRPTYQERIWGGQSFKSLFNREIPEDKPIGESWEVCDRPEAQTWVIEKDCSLHDLWTSDNKLAIFGKRAPATERFPILIKLLDAKEKLSLQVHPPAHKAKELNGEPKTEMWFFLHTEDKADIFVGLKNGISVQDFEKAIEDKTVADCFHRLETSAGETMFLPSGRVHAIGSGNVILEIQQNSDTTYRVYDWDRVGTDGKPRDLHVKESLECINFNDYEPTFTQPHGEKVVDCDHFLVQRTQFEKDELRELEVSTDSFQYLFVAAGKFRIGDRDVCEKGTGLFVTADTGSLEIEQKEEDYGVLVTVSFP